MRFRALVACCAVLVSCGTGLGGDGASSIPLHNPDGTSPLSSAGASSMMGLDPSGNPIIAYHDATMDKVKVMHCNDRRCAGGDEEIAIPDRESTHEGAGGVVMTLDASGYPVLDYDVAPYDNEAAFRIAHCRDPGCTGEVSVTDPIPQAIRIGAVSHPQSLVLDGAGNPVVMTTTGILRCNDPDCAGSDDRYMSLTDDMYGDNSLMWSQLVGGADDNPVLVRADVGLASVYETILAVYGDPFCADRPVQTILPDGGIVQSGSPAPPEAVAGHHLHRPSRPAQR